MFREKRKFNITKTPDIYIEQTSTPDEVQEWLKAKGFSDQIRRKMKGLNGEDLFLLPKDKLEEFCGEEEGKRLASQITVQRSVNKVKFKKSNVIIIKSISIARNFSKTISSQKYHLIYLMHKPVNCN